MASLLRILRGACRVGLPMSRSGISLPSSRLYSSPAVSQLQRCVETELGLEEEALSEPPNIPSFETSLRGSIATLQRTHGQEIVKVELDANDAIEVTPEDEDLGEEPFFVPAFTVTVMKPSGSCLQLECSFDEHGSDLQEKGGWESLCIDSISIVPGEATDVGAIYSADTRNLSEDLYASLVGYLHERGIDENFAQRIIPFYRAFEHQCYVRNFLQPLKYFLQQ